MNRKLLLICGPTASGKSGLAVELARRLDGEVVSIDSVQIFRGCDIGAAKLRPEERGGIPHHMLDIRDADQPCNAAQFIEAAERSIAAIQAGGKRAILCGGTTLYITALLHGLAAVPAAEPALRAELEALPEDALFERLRAADPAAALRLHPRDRVRVIRALETHALAGQAASKLLEQHGYRERRYSGVALVLCWPRDQLYERINARSGAMIAAGLIAETRELLRRFGPAIPVLRTLGYSQAHAFLQGALGESEIVPDIAKHTRRLAKRLMTFWRNEPGKRGWRTLPAPGEAAASLGAEGLSPRGARKGFGVMRLSPAELVARLEAALADDRPQDLQLWYLDAPHLQAQGLSAAGD